MLDRLRKVTLKKWIIRNMFAGVIMVGAVAFTIPWYIGSKMREQATASSEKLSEVYLEFLDSNVEGINKVLSQFATSTYDISVLARSADSMERYIAKQNVMQKLEDASIIYHVFDGIFVNSKSETEEIFLCQVGRKGSGSQVSDMKQIMADFEEKYPENTWILIKHGAADYLVRAVTSGSTSCGAWIDVSSLSIPLEKIDYSDTGTALFLDRDGYAVGRPEGLLTGKDRLSVENNGNLIRIAGAKYLQIIKPSRILPVSMAILVPEEKYIGNIYRIQNAIGLVLAAALFVIPVLWRMLSKSVSRPVDQLVHSMNEVQKGNLDTRVEPESRFYEFDEMGTYFNNMVSEIKRLQEDVYERKIREQKIQLQYLQAQIRPHFFLNSLNVIHSFSLVKRNDLIEQMVVCLSRYFSYRFKDSDALVSLKEEKEHIENYLKLHQLRYQNTLSCMLEIEEVLLDAKLPPLVIQTFVENSLKYGLSSGADFELEIVAETFTVEKVHVHGPENTHSFTQEQKLRITVSDNGPGYEAEVLKSVGLGEPLKKGHGQGIGINNVIQRLRLIYGDEAQVRLSNIPGAGASSEIILPLEFMDEDNMEEIMDEDNMEEFMDEDIMGEDI